MEALDSGRLGPWTPDSRRWGPAVIARMEKAPDAPRQLFSKAWSAETLNAGMVTVDAQQCKNEASTPDTDAARKQRIEEIAARPCVVF